jgi:hypothetical protein
MELDESIPHDHTLSSEGAFQYSVRSVYRVPEHGCCRQMSLRMQAFHAMKAVVLTDTLKWASCIFRLSCLRLSYSICADVSGTPVLCSAFYRVEAPVNASGPRHI